MGEAWPLVGMGTVPLPKGGPPLVLGKVGVGWGLELELVVLESDPEPSEPPLEPPLEPPS